MLRITNHPDGSTSTPLPPSSRTSNALWINASTLTGQANGSAFVGSAGGFLPANSGAPIYRASAFRNAKACLEFDGESAALRLPAGSALDAASSGSLTVQFVYQAASPYASYETLLNRGGGADTKIHFLVGNGFYGRFNGVQYSPGTYPSADFPHLFQYVFDAAAHVETLYLDGIQVAQVTGATPALAGGDWVIGSNGGSNFFKGLLAQVVIDSAALSPAQLQSDARYFASLYAKDNLLIAEGDSRTYGADATAAGGRTLYPWPVQIATALGAGWTVVNRGVSGRHITDLISAYAAEVNTGQGLFYRRTRCVLFAAVNDLATGSTPAQAWSAMQTLMSMHESAGLPYVLCAEPDSGQAGHTDYNAHLLAGTSACPGVRSICRLDLDARVGAAGAALNPLYGDGSNLHWRGQDAQGNPGGGEGVFAEMIALRLAAL